MRKDLDEPAALRYKGITIVPGGFLTGASLALPQPFSIPYASETYI